MNRLLAIGVLITLLILPLQAKSQTAAVTNCPEQYSFSHCGLSLIDFEATGVGPIRFELVSGPGQIDPETGLWSWSGETVPQAGTDAIGVRVSDDNGPGAICTVDIEVTNQAPSILCPAGVKTIWSGQASSQTVQLDDDCDELTVTILDNGNATGIIEVVGAEIRFTPSDDDGMLNPLIFWVQVSDGEATATCTVEWNILCCARPPSVEIVATAEQLQGQFTELDVVLHGIIPFEGLAGFDFLFGYDQSALSMPSAIEGDVYAECGWEYFTYRIVTGCGGGCPSGLLRVVGVANLNDGPRKPGCDSPDAGYIQRDQLPISLVKLRFLVSNDRTLQCQFAPVKFFWIDCGDNVLSNIDGSVLALSSKVFDYVDDDEGPFFSGQVQAVDDFPTYLGAQDECVFEDEVGGKAAIRQVWYQNGGVGFRCSQEVFARGDINRNNIAFEIADAIMLTNYFLIGPRAFGDHVEESIIASDTNADGLSLTVGDLVHLIRVVTGEASAFDR